MNKELAIILAFVMTLITASSNIYLKKGFSKIKPFVGVYVSILISSFFLWILTFLFVPRENFYNYKGIVVFIIIGSFAPTIVRTLTYYGIDKLGAGRAAPVRAMTPFFAVLMAIFLLKESPSPFIFIGILFIACGIVLISRDQDITFKYKRIHYLYPLGAAILAGLAANLRKFGLDTMPHPVFASAVAATSSFFFLTFYVFFKYDRYRKNIQEMFGYKKEFLFIIIAAFLTTFGEIIDLSALLFGKVSLVIPIFGITPFMIILLSNIFLKKHEKITKRIVFSALFIVLGIYITIAST